MKKLLFIPLFLTLAIGCGNTQNSDSSAVENVQNVFDKDVVVKKIVTTLKLEAGLTENLKKVVYILKDLNATHEEKMEMLKNALIIIEANKDESKKIYSYIEEHLKSFEVKN